MNKNEQRYSLPEDTLNAILQYLASKPYNEVAQLIGAVQQQLEKIEPPAPVLTEEETSQHTNSISLDSVI